MSAKTSKLITPERVERILECYGSNPDCWPEDEKTAALSLIQHSAQLLKIQQEAEAFDELLVAGEEVADLSDTDNSELLKQIVGELPMQDKYPDAAFKNKQLGHKKSILNSHRWIGAVAASVAIFVISMSIVELRPVSVIPPLSNLAQVELDQWMWEQEVGEVIDEDGEPLTMMALLELDEL